MPSTPLHHASPGAIVRITDVSGDERTVHRVREMGLTVGAVCRLVRKAPFGGPIEVVVGRTHIGLRSSNDLCILVEPYDAVAA
jgi:Fe2+ transport system protein FeoA